MKKTLMIAACMFLLASTIALADTVRVTSKTLFSEPEGELVTSEVFAFRGTLEIVFEVAGRTCILNGSALGSQNGCNYTIVVEPDGSISGELRAGSSNCTQTEDIPASCRVTCN